MTDDDYEYHDSDFESKCVHCGDSRRESGRVSCSKCSRYYENYLTPSMYIGDSSLLHNTKGQK